MENGNDADVIVIGAGGGGAVAAKELCEKGIKVLLIEAGPWFGNKQWPNPNAEKGAAESFSYDDLSIDLLSQSFSDLEDDMNNLVTGKLRWGPADRNRPPWPRAGGLAWQNAGIGGSTLHYFANSPRAYPQIIDDSWPFPYSELIPYYEKAEIALPVYPAPVTAKEELFYYGAKKSGWKYSDEKDLRNPAYRPQPNAIFPVNPLINNPDFNFQTNQSVGCTLRGQCINGCHIGPTIEGVAKRSTLVSYIPRALSTGNLVGRPNTFVTKIVAEEDSERGLHVSGVLTKNTWTGEENEYRAPVLVLSAGGIESPRLWLNSGLPENPWVGRGMTTHWFDCLSGIFEEEVLMNILGLSDIKPYVGQNAAARFDYPGLGVIMTVGFSPGLFSSTIYGLSSTGFNLMNKATAQKPWDYEGLMVGEQLKKYMIDYRRTLSLTIFTDDEVDQKNGITLDKERHDENGFIPLINYIPTANTINRREQLAVIAADILRKAGAKTIFRSNYPAQVFIHIMSTMRMNYVTDANCEAKQVKGLYIADNSVLFNGLGGPNPTLTTQALATRTAEKIVEKYFS